MFAIAGQTTKANLLKFLRGPVETLLVNKAKQVLSEDPRATSGSPAKIVL